MSKSLSASASALCLLSLAAPALAQDASDDEIITTALRAVSVDDVSASVTVIDEAALSVRASAYVADQLRAVPGVGLSRSGAVGSLTQIRIRGAEANHTLVLVDGIEVSNPVTGETDFGLWGGVGANRIEVARGEQSALYGSDAIGGVVAITTGADGLNAIVEYGSFDTKRAAVNIGTETDGIRLGFNAAYFGTDGVDTAGLDKSDAAYEADGSEVLSIGGTIGVNLGTDWSANARVSYRDSSVETDPDLNFDGILDNADRISDSEQILLGANLSRLTGAVSHIIRASYNDVTQDNRADGTFTDATDGQRLKLAYSPSVDLGTEDRGVTLSGLIDYEAEDYERISTNTLFGDPNQSASFNTVGVAGEVRARLGAAAINGSLRYDDNDGRFENATTWRVGGAFNTDFGTKLRASFGQGVKNPTFTELFGFFPGSFTGNPNLNPEKSQSWEVGFDHIMGDVSLSATYFDADLEDEIITVFNPDFTSSADNRDTDSTRSGFELSAGWAISPAFTARAAASFIDSDDPTDTPEIRVPDFTASASVDWRSQTKDGLRAGLAVDYVGAQDDLNFGSFPATRVNLGKYALVSASAEYPVNDTLSLTLRGENLLDETVRDVFGFNGTGAGVFFGLRLR